MYQTVCKESDFFISKSESNAGSENTNLTNLQAQKICSEWIWTLTLLGLLEIVFIYLVVATVRYKIKTSGRNEVESRTETNSIRGFLVTDIIWVLFLFAFVLSVMKLCVEIVDTIYAFADDDICTVTRAINAVFTALCLYPIYIVLWLRQRVFYRLPALQSLSNVFVRTLSSGSLFFMAVSGVLPTALYIASRRHVSSNYGCAKTSTSIHYSVPGYVGLSLSISFQVMLLSLFLYPLIMHRRQSGFINRDANRLLKLIKRVVVAAVLTMICDLLGILVRKILEGRFSELSHVYLNYCLAVNQLCVVGSFVDWKQRIFPFRHGETRRRNSSVRKRSSVGSEITSVA